MHRRETCKTCKHRSPDFAALSAPEKSPTEPIIEFSQGMKLRKWSSLWNAYGSSAAAPRSNVIIQPFHAVTFKRKKTMECI
eukprot:6219852-Amphidinium_carterae.1